jgi:mRNA-degrading endonuclease RelE of RelBE toxin-antitoxin system
LRYEIIFAPQAEEDLLALKASQRSEVLDVIETHLRHEPEKVSKSRIKRLRGMKWPQYRLRIGDIRTFYDVFYVQSTGFVEVVGIVEKDKAIKWLTEQGEEI